MILTFFKNQVVFLNNFAINDFTLIVNINCRSGKTKMNIIFNDFNLKANIYKNII